MTKLVKDLTVFDIIEILLVVIIFIFDDNSHMFYFALFSLCIYDAFDIIKDVKLLLNEDVNNKQKVKAVGGILMVIWPIIFFI